MVDAVGALVFRALGGRRRSPADDRRARVWRRWASRRLLDDMGELVGKETLSLRVSGPVLAARKGDVRAGGERLGVDLPRCAVGTLAVMNPDIGEASLEAFLEMPACGGIERAAGLGKEALDRRRGGESRDIAPGLAGGSPWVGGTLHVTRPRAGLPGKRPVRKLVGLALGGVIGAADRQLWP